MSAACRREVQAGEWTYAVRVTCTISKPFVYKSEELNVRAIIGRSFSPFVHGPVVRRKSSARAETPSRLFNSSNCTPADTPDWALFGPNRRARLFLVGEAA